VLFDLDYILQWVGEEFTNNISKFLIAPSTLVFENIHQLEFGLGGHFNWLEIAALTRGSPNTPANAEYVQRDKQWKWCVQCQQGEISFQSLDKNSTLGFCRNLVQFPLLDLEDRGGYSFARGRTD
jgi:hypothetical protein